MTIIERDIDLYTAGKENALMRLRRCEPKYEKYWNDLALKYNGIVTELIELNEMFVNSPYKQSQG